MSQLARSRPVVDAAGAASLAVPFGPLATIALLAFTALLYLWNLAGQGWANAYYAAAVQAGTKSWSAAFFGSFDASNFVTVDKPPASLWVMELSARLFGINYWSLLVPQALEGVATVGLVHLAVRRYFGTAAGLVAGAITALTPVAVVMFRFDNPDALLVLLLTAGTYATLRACEQGSTRWIVLAGALIGTAFLAKMMQAFLVLPALSLTYLVAGRPAWPKRLLQLAGAALATFLAAGWWVAVVQLTPASARPYIGGSPDNNLLTLIFGYNGFGRLTGNERGSVGGGAVPGAMWGPTGWDRLFNLQFGGEASWLIPAALVLLGCGLVLTARRPRTDPARASLIAWGGTLLVTGAVISYAEGIIHPYYTVALAPEIGAVIACSGGLLWGVRDQFGARAALAAAVLAAVSWSFLLLDRTPTWNPQLRPTILASGVVAALVLLLAGGGRPVGPVRAVRPVLAPLGLAIGLLAAMAGPTAYSYATVARPESGAIPSAGPAVAGQLGGPGRGPGGRPTNGGGAFTRGRFGGQTGGQIGARQLPPGAVPRLGPGLTGPGAAPGGGGAAGAFPGGPGGAAGGLLSSSRPGTAITALLRSGDYRWTAATIGANSAAGYQLASDRPVMAIGGFNGTDPTPTLSQFEAYVAAGQVHYFIGGRGGRGSFAGPPPGAGPGGANGPAAAISAWVTERFTAQTVDGVTVYDLTQAVAGAGA